MRDRPFIPASEQPRPFSEIKRERGDVDLRARLIEDIAAIEDQALGLADDCNEAAAMKKRLEAEELRCALYHMPRR